jgi:hypothetical protein
MCCNNCERTPQGPQGVPGIVNVLFQNNSATDTGLPNLITEPLTLSNTNILEYIATEHARYRVSLQCKLEPQTVNLSTVTIYPYVGTGTQIPSNLGTNVSYLGGKVFNFTGVEYIVYEFDVELQVGESIGLVIIDTALYAVNLLDNIFVVDKIELI